MRAYDDAHTAVGTFFFIVPKGRNVLQISHGKTVLSQPNTRMKSLTSVKMIPAAAAIIITGRPILISLSTPDKEV
jgi:hypothetical protein